MIRQRATHTQHQLAIAGTEFEHLQRRAIGACGRQVAQGTRDDGLRAHRTVDAPQVAARTDGGGVVGGQRVERFGGHHAHRGHATFNSAPWQLKPAPNDDNHHQPPGAASASAASSTK